MTIYNVTNNSDLATALSSAGAGDTINLADGSYGNVTISSLDKNDNTASADPPLSFAPVDANGARNPTFFDDWEADPARPENMSLVLIQGGTNAVMTTLIVNNCSGLHFKGFTVSRPTVSFDNPVVRLRGCACCMIDQLTVYGAPLASDVSAHNGTGYGRGQGIVIGNTAGPGAGEECTYISIRGCYVDHVNDGIRVHSGGGIGQSAPSNNCWVYKNTVYQVSTDAFRLDGLQDSIFERNLLPYYYHPTINNGEAAHNDTFQSSTQGASRVGILLNIRIPGFASDAHTGHTEGSTITMQGPFLADGAYVDCVVAQNFMVIGNQNAIWFGEDGVPGTSGVLGRNNTLLRDPKLSSDDSQGNNNTTLSIRSGGTGTLTRNVRTGGVNVVGVTGSSLLTLGYGTWAGSYEISDFYDIDTTAAYASWTCSLSDLVPVGGALTDPVTYGTSTYGAYEVLEELAANNFAWPPAVAAAAAGSTSQVYSFTGGLLMINGLVLKA